MKRTPDGTAAVAPWTRTRLRASWKAASALALLVMACAFIAAALPRTFDRYQAHALDHTLSSNSVTGTGIEGAVPLSGGESGLVQPSAQLTPANLSSVGAKIRAEITSPLATPAVLDSNGVHTTGASDNLTDSFLPVLSSKPPVVNLDWQPDLGTHVKLVSGRLPQDPARFPVHAANSLYTQVPRLEIAVSESTAHTMHLRIGSVLHVRPSLNTSAVVQLQVVGIYQPLDRTTTYWAAEPGLAEPDLREYTNPRSHALLYYWHMEAAVSAGAMPWLPDIGDSEAYWWYPVDPHRLTPSRIGAAQAQLISLDSGPKSTVLHGITNLAQAPDGVSVESGLSGLLGSFTTQVDAITDVLTIGEAGTAGVAVAVLLMTAGLASDRRLEELGLLRARGASMPALAQRLLSETLVCTVPGAVIGTGLALLLLPTPHWRTAVLAAAALWLLVSLAVPLRSLARHRRLTAAGRAEGLLSARPSRRRTVVELAVLGAAAAAAFSLRRQGVSGGGGGDLLLALAPLLLALACALVLIRLYPWPVRALSRPSARLRGAVGFLGLARAGRTRSTVSLLPLTALLLALTVGAFGAEIVNGISSVRDADALAEVHADASVSSSTTLLPPALVTAVGHSAGVHSVVDIRIDPQEAYNPGDLNYDLDLIDPAGYASLARRVGSGSAFPAALLHYSGHGPIPVAATPELAGILGSRPVALDDTAYGNLQIKVVATVSQSLAPQTAEVMLVPRAAVEQPLDRQVFPRQVLLLSGPVDAAALRSTVARTRAGTTVAVAVRTDVLAAQARNSTLQVGAEGLYAWTVLAAALLSVLAVLLALTQAAPGRAALLARLRTMGLTRRQGYRLILLESLPQILLGVTAGTALGIAAIPLFGPSVDFSELVATDNSLATAALRVQLTPLVVPVLALLGLAVAAVVAETAVIGRQQIGTELRAGDQR